VTKTDVEKPRIYWIDFMRAVAILSVVWLHVSGQVINQFGNVSTLVWWVANIGQSLVRTSVPLFFMITGALYLGREDDWKTFLQKRAVKILIPLVVWAVMYQHNDIHPPYLEATLKLAKKVIEGNVYYHLWFFYSLIGLYLFIPILQIFIQHTTRSLLIYFLALWFVAASLFPFLDQVTDVYPGINLTMMAGYTGYLVLGYLLAQWDGEMSTQRWIIFGCLIFGLLMTSLGTYFISVTGGANQYFYDYLSPNVILMSGAGFLLLKNLGARLPANQIILQLSKASFGIYLVHVAVLTIFDGRLHFTALSGNPIYMMPLVWVAALAASFVIVYVLQKIPVARLIVP
jgi:surface polysaccharide O-acyltransferase-like enzyme